MDLVAVKKAVNRIKGALFKNANSFSIGMLKSHFKVQRCLRGVPTRKIMLTHVDLSSDKLGDDLFTSFAKSLERGHPLISLRIRENKITDQGFKHFPSLLDQHPRTMPLVFYSNQSSQFICDILLEDNVNFPICLTNTKTPLVSSPFVVFFCRIACKTNWT